MSEILPDLIHKVPIEGGELCISPAYDIVHRWREKGFSILRYWQHDKGSIVNIPLADPAANYLEEKVGALIIERETFYEHEYSIFLDFTAENLDNEYQGEFDEMETDEGEQS